ncbi:MULTISPECIES: sugar transporter [unclassified Gilliamella]|uniref:sugar transporter n=1 Tax=unclassified Gilliamella TaxID=2685620 RepID=UPI001C69B9B6|nr:MULTISPECIES: sugar transporter [unclassified Gilliamella]MCX8600485.1 sugar transporter [Gilliamella sp. B3722]MCX8608803.1 sugar transporter [Gilliamella sp. B3771]MCX8609701.1 sugar transporter [Gilliamella sp. B3891]MCX8612209.1 sugar transporter [Gilliamella sp. B3773]MCX8616603.1 sugar transporter [Gilliamella sp. B3770]
MNTANKRSRIWSSILCLAFAGFIFNTTEFVPVGLLPNIAESFSMDVAHTGLLLTIYAWAVSLLSLPLTVLTSKMERRKLLIFLFCLFISSHILAGFAWDFYSLMTARIGIACAHAVFWAITTPLAVRLAPNGKRAKAMGFIVVGTSMATVLGIPIGTMIGQLVGWRITFLCIAVLAFCIMVLLLYLLPSVPSMNTISLKDIPKVLKRPVLINIYLLTAIIITGHFTAYTYITPFMLKVGGFSQHMVVILLLAVGFSGMIGSVIFAKYAEKHPTAILVIPMILLMLCLLSLYVCALSFYTAIIQGMVWGLAITIIGMVMQSKVIDVAPDAADIATSVYSGIYNIGIGGGAFVGSQVLVVLSTHYIGFIGAIFVVIALLLFFVLTRKSWIKPL